MSWAVTRNVVVDDITGRLWCAVRPVFLANLAELFFITVLIIL